MVGVDKAKLFFLVLFGSLLMSAAPASACQGLIFSPVESHIDSADAIVYARIASTKVVRISEIGAECNTAAEPSHCRMIEVRTDVFEVFKGVPNEVHTFYMPFVPSDLLVCDFQPLAGEEYVLFLSRENGLLRKHQPSFLLKTERIPDHVLREFRGVEKLEELRRWKASQMN